MKIKPNTLSQWFKWIRKSPVDDLVKASAKSNVDDLALGALDVVDDIPASVSLDDITDAYKNHIPMDKPPITTDEFVANYKAQMPAKYETRQMLDLFPEQYVNAPTELDLALLDEIPEYGLSEPLKMDSTPDYNAMDIRPEKFGAIPSLKDSIEYPDGFTDPDAFARYHTALQQGYMSEGIEPYIKDFQRKPSHASFSLNKPKLNVVELPELFNILYSN